MRNRLIGKALERIPTVKTAVKTTNDKHDKQWGKGDPAVEAQTLSRVQARG